MPSARNSYNVLVKYVRTPPTALRQMIGALECHLLCIGENDFIFYVTAQKAAAVEKTSRKA